MSGAEERRRSRGPRATVKQRPEGREDTLAAASAARRQQRWERDGKARVVAVAGRVWRSVGRARISALGLIRAAIALAALGGLVAFLTQPGAPGPLVISAPTATPAPFFLTTPTLVAYPTSTVPPGQGGGFSDTTPNAPTITTPGAGGLTLCPPNPAPTTTAETPTPTPAGCTPCGVYMGGNPDQGQIRSALATAANVYRLPHNLLFAVAWEESSWHEDIVSCSGGVGLMQIQADAYSWLNQQSVPACQIGVTGYDPFTLEGNADLGAKYLKYLSCFYSYWGADANATLTAPAAYTAAWYYQQAKLSYPDSAQSHSLCADVFQAHAYYAALPSTIADPWSCPYSAVAGDFTLLDLTLSAYNQGAGATNAYGMQNLSYVRAVEGFIPSFASGALGV